MEPWQLGIFLAVALICGFAGDRIGKYKGRGYGFPLGFLLGVIGLVILACLPRTEDAKVEARTRQMRIEREAAARLDADGQR